MMKESGFGFSRATLGAFVLVVLASGTAAFLAGAGNPRSQVAVGAAADAMCLGGADAKCPCGTGLKNGQCDKGTRGGGKIGCPCQDMTAGAVAASGKCQTVGKCLATEAGGMPPMLPMLPMPMPKPPSQQQQEPCTATTSPGVSQDMTIGGSKIPCLPENRSAGVSAWLRYGETISDSSGTSSVATSSVQATSTLTQRQFAIVRFLESVGIFQAGTSTDEEDVDDGPLPVLVIFGRDDAGHLRFATGTVAYEHASTSWAIVPGARGFGESTFSYSDPIAAQQAVLSRVASTLERMLDRIRAWMQ